MHEIITERCIQCGICSDSCPIQAIGLYLGAIYQIDEVNCTDCRICVTSCPLGAIQPSVRQTPD